MPVTPARVRQLALAFEDAAAAPHMDRTAFRTPRKIFATLANDGADLNLLFDRELQRFYCEQVPMAFAPVPGGWGRMGFTRCDLKKVDAATLQSALKAAHALAGPKPKKKRPPKRR
jgi:hypothetical protein